MQKLLQNKKGIEVWISWVLLIGFAAAIGVLMQDFLAEFTEENVELMQRIAINTEDCNLVALSIDSACTSIQGATTYLNMSISNRLNIRIDGINIRSFSSSRVINQTIETLTNDTITLNPGQSRKVEVQTVPGTDSVQIIPFLDRSDDHGGRFGAATRSTAG